jgi:hypothetical protein
MMFADFGEGRLAPGVAQPSNRRQANGLPAYGTAPGLLPALPPNFAAVNLDNLGDDVGLRMPRPTSVIIPTRSTTLPASVQSLTALSTTHDAKLATDRYPLIQTAPGPQPISPSVMPIGPQFPGMDQVGVAAGEGAEKVGALVNSLPSKGMSTGLKVGLGLLAAAAAATGIVIIWKHR